MIQKNHYSPQALNDSFSARVFNLIIDGIDDQKIFFTNPEYEKLALYKYKLDDEIAGKSWGFVNQLTFAYQAGLKRADSIIRILLQQPLNLDKTDFLKTGHSVVIPENTAALQLRISQWLRSELLEILYDLRKTDSSNSTKDKALKDEPVARKQLAATYKRSFAGILSDQKELNNAISDIYLKSIAASYDPHTEFFPAEEKDAFEESLSSNNMKFGFTLNQANDGDVEVVSIVPGSPAWNSGSIHVNDKLVSIKTAGGREIPVKNAAPGQLDSVFSDPSQSLELTVQSSDGKLTAVKLQKALVSNEENFVKGYVIELEGKKTGYIALPSFYSGWDENGGGSCANDVAKEIVKLKKEGIESLLLDLRYNGGGNVEEAIELSGIFIDAGPILLAKETGGKTTTLKDPSRGTIYDGPLGILINGQSASASELVAGALQDYNRAVIIGSNSFGKATMQSILPIDTTFDLNKATGKETFNRQNGFVKITLGKIYRITGGSNQLNGVTPDVKLPDLIEATDYTERSLPYALPSDTVMKKVFYTTLKPLPLQQLQQRSSQRLAGSEYFKDLSKQLQETKKVTADNNVPLQWEAYRQWREKQTAHIQNKKNLFKVYNAAFDTKLIELNDFEREQNAILQKTISNDAFVEEAARIMMDLKTINQ